MTVIFNSLGSNYSGKDARKLKKTKAEKGAREKLKIALKEFYFDKPVQIELFYKGREALEMGLRSLNLPAGSQVGITGFTCYVVEQSVARAGLQPVFLDVERGGLNFGVKSLERAAAKGAKLQVLILQNTFGFQMTELTEVLQWAKKNKIIVIEDVAHGLGLHYQIENGTFCGPFGTACGKNGPCAGILGDMAILSFSQDKMLDVVSGGALLINNPELKIEREKLREMVKKIPAAQQKKDRSYAWRMRLIRNWYSWGWGKIWHKQWKAAGKLSNPMTYAGDEEIHGMTKWQAGRAVEILRSGEFEEDLNRRRRLAHFYWREIDDSWLVSGIKPVDIDLGACLRWPILVPAEKREGLIKYLAKRGFYVSDVWYSSVIAPEKWAEKSSYKSGKCPQGEKLAAQIFNLPTHKQMDLKKAKKIVHLVNNYLKNSK